MKRLPPYNVAIVEFAQCNGVRLISNVVGAAEHDLRIGMRMALFLDTDENGVVLPRFRPAGGNE